MREKKCYARIIATSFHGAVKVRTDHVAYFVHSEDMAESNVDGEDRFKMFSL